MTQSAEIDSRVSQLEKVVEELSGVVKEIQTSLAVANADNKAITTTQTLLAAKVEALLAKMGTGDIPIVIEESSGTSPRKEEDLPFLKMDLLSFDGTDARGWLARAEQYFLVHETPAAKKLKLVMIASRDLRYHSSSYCCAVNPN